MRGVGLATIPSHPGEQMDIFLGDRGRARDVRGGDDGDALPDWIQAILECLCICFRY